MDLKNTIFTRILQIEDVTQSYVMWYSDAAVVEFSDNQYKSFSLESQKEYVRKCLINDNVDLYGIYDDSLHIGNIIIDGLSSPHKRAEISYVIGDQTYWGKGVASEAINQIVRVSISNYNLHKLVAGCSESNVGSIKALQANGFKLEGTRKDHLFYNNSWHNQVDFGLLLKNKSF